MLCLICEVDVPEVSSLEDHLRKTHMKEISCFCIECKTNTLVQGNSSIISNKDTLLAKNKKRKHCDYETFNESAFKRNARKTQYKNKNIVSYASKKTFSQKNPLKAHTKYAHNP